MTLKTLVKTMQAWGDMGWAIQQQLSDLVNGEAPKEQNPNALQMIKQYLEHLLKVIDDEELEGEINTLLAEIV